MLGCLQWQRIHGIAPELSRLLLRCFSRSDLNITPGSPSEQCVNFWRHNQGCSVEKGTERVNQWAKPCSITWLSNQKSWHSDFEQEHVSVAKGLLERKSIVLVEKDLGKWNDYFFICICTQVLVHSFGQVVGSSLKEVQTVLGRHFGYQEKENKPAFSQDLVGNVDFLPLRALFKLLYNHVEVSRKQCEVFVGSLRSKSGNIWYFIVCIITVCCALPEISWPLSSQWDLTPYLATTGSLFEENEALMANIRNTKFTSNLQFTITPEGESCC